MSSEQRDELLDTFERDAFHLELKDEYGIATEDEPFALWLRGEAEDSTWLQPWLDRVRKATQAGKTVRRVRVVTEPITDYIRWEYVYTWLNEEAGEDIRWLPRHRLPEGIIFPVGGNDWWLFDDRFATVNHFHDDGRVRGSELVTDPAAVAHCVHIRDTLWPLAIPHREYEPA